MIAVRSTLLSQSRQLATTVLTGEVALRLVALAHTVTYLATVVGERSTGSMEAYRAGLSDVRRYVSGIARDAHVAGRSADGLRHPVPDQFGLEDGHHPHLGCGASPEAAVAEIEVKTAAGRYDLTVLQLGPAPLPEASASKAPVEGATRQSRPAAKSPQPAGRPLVPW